MRNIDYKISTELPPKALYRETQLRFGADFYAGTVYTYGDTIHINNPKDMTDDLLEHEKTHVKQQTTYPGGVDAWWDKYLQSELFRYDQELEAYGVQVQVLKKTLKDRNQFFKKKLKIAQTLAGPLYGNLVHTQKAFNDLDEAEKIICMR